MYIVLTSQVLVYLGCDIYNQYIVFKSNVVDTWIRSWVNCGFFF